MHGRNLGGGDIEVDYTVLAMAATTLVLLLVFESIRHYIDHSAEGNRFAKAVLATVYRELTTLGSVEAFIFILLRYDKNLSLAHEQVFASVHFTFFYVAIFNTIQTILLAIMVRRKTDVIWVQVEDIEIGHYVAIRKKFNKVDGKLKALGHNHDSLSEEVISLRGIATFMIEMIRHPTLKREHKKLLKQIRFHEMRVHFMESNKLHPKFRVSAYLKECELRVLESLVDITANFWLIFMSAVILMYFLCGIIQANTLNSVVVGTFMGSVFLGMCVLFNIIAYLFYQKMTKVYYHILHSDEYDIGTNRTVGEKRKSQKDLFWWRRPYLIINALQLMQFGFAITFAVLLVWSDLLDEDHSTVPFFWYCVTPSICYVLFLDVCVNILPKFTVCTSLGQLVRERQLRNILAKFNLEQENLKRDRLIESKANNDDKSQSSKPNSLINSSPAEVALKKPGKKQSVKHANRGTDFLQKSRTVKMKQLNELVKSDVNDLPNIEFKVNGREARKQRRARMKSLSDGVSAMRLFSTTSEAASNALHETEEKPSNNLLVDIPLVKANSEIPTKSESRPRKQRLRSHSANVELMRNPSEDLFFGTKEKNVNTVNVDRKSKNTSTLTSLLEDIPARAAHPSELLVSIGRCEDLQKSLQKMSSENVGNSGKPRKAQRSTSESSMESTSNYESDISQSVRSESLTINSIRSEDGHSVGELPEVLTPVDSSSKRFGESVINFVQSENFQKFSSVISTLIVTYVCAMRVEVLELQNKTLKNLDNTWHLQGNVLFWIELSLLSWFIFVGAMSLFISALPFGATAKVETVIAEVIDVFFSSVCIGILIWAELQRCNDKEMCVTFGSRYSGGIGKIEPFTFLIFLRSFRYVLGRWLGGFYSKLCSSKTDKSEDQEMQKKKNDNHDHKHFQQRYGTVTDLWVKAIETFPEIVEEHGKFSGELFQAMLFGPEKVFIEKDKKSKRNSQSKTKSVSTRSETIFDQESKQPLLSRGDSISCTSSLPRDLENLDKEALTVILKGSIRLPNISISEADDDMYKGESPYTDPVFQETFDLFSFPDSTLVRSMRRCERKFLPLFNEWETVDVVTTRREIVLFAVTNNNMDEQLKPDTNDSKIRHTLAIQRAMASTNGGKGLRLCDVAYGRKMIGSMLISDIDNIKLKVYQSKNEKFDLNTSAHGHSKRRSLDEESGRTLTDDILEEEYWRQSNIDSEYLAIGREERWQNISKEERLFLHSTTNNCTLQLRFFVDLANCEYQHVTTTEVGMRRSEGASLWCQTVARLCGPNQLKQKCPHLGDGSSDELGDFIENHERNKNLRGTMHRIFSSKADLSALVHSPKS